MKISRIRTLTAFAALAALCACGGGGGAIPGPISGNVPARERVHDAGSILSSIVGVGDSLTAGYQSDGFLGETGVHAVVGSQTYPVPPNQVTGWWADLYEQASGKPLDEAISQMFDPSTSPLPLIAGPGLNNQIISAPGTGFPIAEQKSGDVCTDNNDFNEDAYRLSGLSRVRLDPASPNIRDVGIPGLTLHEALTLHQPQTNTCKELPGIPGLLSVVVADESGTFWPVLGNFTKLGYNLTDVNAAASRHPTLATVWLGANDVLKYMGSGGRFVGGDRNASQAASDLRASISAMQRAGAKVVVANLPDILQAGYFERVTVPTTKKLCQFHSYVMCLFSLAGTPQFALQEIVKKYKLAAPGCVPASTTKPCGYLTLPGVIAVIQVFGYTGKVPNLDCNVPAPGCKGAPGNGLGQNYITPEFAGKVQALNTAINQGIDDAANGAHVPLVDVHAIFAGLASANPANPYFALAASINPKGPCCTLGYLYGITSFDGLHPSNTGYALIAYEFINAINKTYGTKIPQIDVTAVYDGSRCSTKKYCFHDPYAPPYDLRPL